ncbi:uncharacterized protein K02A2.6-like [Bacillus rossius redtenbacheri]|uniref:uncharacterized protein K02A2.6-like n=1 Tax=Bacillus rossius redtenbacheri TaxID=93214 RepID=UPI002FDE3FF5
MFTRWVEAYPVSNVRSGTLVASLEGEVFPQFGYPAVLLSDNRGQFRGARWREACRKWGVKHHTTPMYYPRANPTERRNQEFKAQLRLQLGNDHTKWDIHIPNLLYYLRRQTNAATGYSPAELVQGQNLALPSVCRVAAAATEGEMGEALRIELSVMQDQARQRQEAYVQKTTPVAGRPSPPLEPGDMVHVRQHHLSSKAKNFNVGLAPKWSEPRQVIRKFGPTSYLVRTPSGQPAKIHRDDLRRAGGDQAESETTEVKGGSSGNRRLARSMDLEEETPHMNVRGSFGQGRRGVQRDVDVVTREPGASFCRADRGHEFREGTGQEPAG